MQFCFFSSVSGRPGVHLLLSDKPPFESLLITFAVLTPRDFIRPQSPIFQTYEAFLSAVEFSDAEAPKVVDAAADCFRNARTMASDQHRRLDSLVKEMSAAGRGAAPTGSISGRSTNGTFARVIGCGGWDNEGSDLMALVRLAISNSVAATRVLVEAESWRTGGLAPAGSSDRRKARARLNFGTHGQFPVVKVTFD